jgi:hypothetical protein
LSADVLHALASAERSQGWNVVLLTPKLLPTSAAQAGAWKSTAGARRVTNAGNAEPWTFRDGF